MRKAAIVALCAGLALSSWAVARALSKPEAWPEAALGPAVTPVFPAGFGTRRVYLDPGHGAPGNSGNKSAFCRDEQSFTLSLAEAVAEALTKTGHFEVRLSRSGDALTPYAERVRHAEAWPADVLVSLHSDVRGRAEPWQGATCPRSHSAPGFSLLWSDHGEERAVTARVRIARALARALESNGFLPYDGTDYAPTYAPDVQQPGVFVDRHSTSERVYVLWRPAIPSVIVETHNALDDREALRWEEPATRAAFAASVATALASAL